ncbi:MAG TPA: GWxTD domain-containing protein, partial [Ignavibacteriaceae bacterium]
EFYYSFNQASLVLVSSDTGKYVSAVLSVLVADSASGEIIIDKDWLVRNDIEDSLFLNTNLIGQLAFMLREGAYKCEFSGSDPNNPAGKKTITDFIRVTSFIKQRTSISDIQLSSKILQDSENTSSIFYKNSFEVVPVPTAIFGESQPVLFFYVEMYNLAGTSVSGELKLEQMVINSRDYMMSHSVKKINRKINSRVEVGKVLIHKLPTDTYTLVLNLIDSTANYGVFSTKKFFVYNPNVVAVDTLTQTTTSTLGTMFGVMSEEELDDLFAKSKYVATSNEMNQYSKLTNEEGKREFMNTFWNARDDNPDDVRNEFFLSYLKRIDESNLKYSGMGREGWKTDRGRVFLLYGDPNEIEKFPNETDTRPYEIWTYHDIEGGVYFVFADLTGFSDYQLVHSTKRGELRDDNWARRIVIN